MAGAGGKPEVQGEERPSRFRKWRSWRQGWWRWCLVGSAVGLAVLSALSMGLRGSPEEDLMPRHHPVAGVNAREGAAEPGRMVVASWNLGHGRGDALSQWVVGKQETLDTLGEVGSLLIQHQVTLAAVQEVDQGSFWTSGLDLPGELARSAGFPWEVAGHHVSGLGLAYGTAILSCHPMEEARSVSFEPTPPTFPKGFVTARVKVPGMGHGWVRFVSLHLDFVNPRAQLAQVRRLVSMLEGNQDPLILAGDFNSSWSARPDNPLQFLIQTLGVRAYAPEGRGDATFPKTGGRLDWILAGPEFSFENYRVILDPMLSDHRPVIVTLRWVGAAKGLPAR